MSSVTTPRSEKQTPPWRFVMVAVCVFSAQAALAADAPKSPAEVKDAAATTPAEMKPYTDVIANGEFAVSVELNAPMGTDASRSLSHVGDALAAGIDIVNVADGPRATSRMSNLAFCALALARYVYRREELPSFIDDDQQADDGRHT